jgi:catechol 2,3-dioxygenase-like lactoylglutathione lyase family enzyme
MVTGDSPDSGIQPPPTEQPGGDVGGGQHAHHPADHAQLHLRMFVHRSRVSRTQAAGCVPFPLFTVGGQQRVHGSAGRWPVTFRVMDTEVVPVLYVADASRAVAWYERLGFYKEWEHQFEPGFPWFVSVMRGQARLYLSEHKGDARPNTLIHLYVGDIDAVSQEFGVPVDEDGLAGRECDFDDPDGNRLRVATRRS